MINLSLIQKQNKRITFFRILTWRKIIAVKDIFDSEMRNY